MRGRYLKSLQSGVSALVRIKEMLEIFIFVFIIQIPILISINYLRKNRLLSNVRVIGVIAYIAVIINLTLWPPLLIHPSISWSQISINLIPFKSIVGSLNHFYYMVGIRNVLGNFVLLLPLAVLLKLKGTKGILLHGLFISLSIEIIQVLLTKAGVIFPRTFDIDDIILNSTGFYFVYGLRVVFMKLSKNRKSFENNSEGNDFR